LDSCSTGCARWIVLFEDFEPLDVFGPTVLADLDLEEALANPPDTLMFQGGLGAGALVDDKAAPAGASFSEMLGE
jgi:hypothetical protein